MLNRIRDSVKALILRDFKDENKIYTSWTSTGEGKEEISWLKVVSLLFLRDDEGVNAQTMETS